MTTRILWTGLLAFVSLVASGPAAAIQIEWAGTILAVEEDDGTGAFSGNGVGDGLSGAFRYPETCGASCSQTDEADESDYFFSALDGSVGSLLSDGIAIEVAQNAGVNLQDDHALSAEEAALASALLGTTVTAGTLVDVYTLFAEGDDTVFDSNDELFDGGVVEVVLGSFDTSLLPSTAFDPVPPSLADVDFAFFFFSEADMGVVTYEVIGSLDAIAVPEPGTALLLLAPLAALVAGPRGRG